MLGLSFAKVAVALLDTAAFLQANPALPPYLVLSQRLRYALMRYVDGYFAHVLLCDQAWAWANAVQAAANVVYRAQQAQAEADQNLRTGQRDDFSQPPSGIPPVCLDLLPGRGRQRVRPAALQRLQDGAFPASRAAFPLPRRQRLG